MSAGRNCTWIWRTTAPLISTLPTPATFCRRLTMTWSVSVETSRRPSVSEYTARLRIGSWFGSALLRVTRGSLTSRGKVGFTSATLSRISCAPTSMSASRRNSMPR
ncbi:hypothetical protein D3C83_42120 [compost metagenome]